MRQVFEQLFGTADDFRAVVKAGISRLITIFAFYVVGHLIISFWWHEWRNPWHIAWTFVGWYATWYLVWRQANRATDAVVIAAASGSHEASLIIERARRFFAIIVITGLVFFWLPAYYSFGTTLGIMASLLLMSLAGPEWSWDQWYKFSLLSAVSLIVSLLLGIVNFSTFFDDPRNGFDSFPWQWVVFLLLIIGALTVVEQMLPKRIASAPTSAKEKKHEH